MYLIIRADANTAIGSGHLMRCLALAQAWQDDGGEAIFITACDNEKLCERITSESFQLVNLKAAHPDPSDWAETAKVLEKHPECMVVLDGYHFDPAYQKKINELGHRLLVIDDMAHLEHYYADFILNQNIGAEDLNYSSEPYTKLLLGPEYVLLRREFSKWRGWQREIPDVAKKILVTLGGGDSDNVTVKVLKALELIDMEGLQVQVVIGSANPHLEEIISCAANSKHEISVKQSPEKMAELMAWADIAVSAGGSTCWELAYMSLPAIVIALAENQLGYCKKISQIGSLITTGCYTDYNELCTLINQVVVDCKLRSDLSSAGQALIDGGGNQRVISALEACSLSMCEAEPDDCYLLWTWANDPETRAQSFSSEPIDLADHRQWYAAKLQDRNTDIFLAQGFHGKPVGVVRFEKEARNRTAVVSITINPGDRGKGLASPVLKLAVEHFLKKEEAMSVKAYVKRDNLASKRTFLKAGFIKDRASQLEALCYIWRRKQL